VLEIGGGVDAPIVDAEGSNMAHEKARGSTT